MSDKKRRLLHVGLAVALIVAGAALLKTLSASKTKIKKRAPATTAAPFVWTEVVKTGPRAVHVVGEGTVRPLEEIDLVPQVGGRVVHLSPSMVNGGFFNSGDVLLKIDPVDYELAVTLARAKVSDSESKLKIAQEETEAAREEWRLLYSEDAGPKEEPPPLVAREPQLAAAQAKLDADRADLKKAELDLERTVISAPFNGRVSSESVDTGQYISKGQVLATLYSTDAAEIVVPLESAALFWFHVPGLTPGRGPGASATVFTSFAGKKQAWQAVVERAEGKLDEKTRMVNIVVRVQRPYARKPPLTPGLFVTVDIKGRVVEHGALIPRAGLRQDNVVWVLDSEDRLRFRKVEVARVQDNEVLIRSGLNNGARVVVSQLKAVSDGMAVRVSRPKKGAGK